MERELTFRPAFLPEDIRPVFVLVLLGALGFAIALHYGSWILAAGTACILLLVLGLPLLFHAIGRKLFSITFGDESIRVLDHLGHRAIPVQGKRCIFFSSIQYMYPIAKEASFLREYRSKLQDIPLPESLHDFRDGTLLHRFKYPDLGLERAKAWRKDFEKRSKCPAQPFLISLISLEKTSLHQLEMSGGVVLSNADGTEKVYVPKYGNLSSQDRQAFLEALRARVPQLECF